MASRKKSPTAKKGRADSGPQKPTVAAPVQQPRNRKLWLVGGAILIAAVVAATALWNSRQPAPETIAQVKRSANPGQIRFENRQPASGVDFVLDNGTVEDKPIIDSMLGGVSLFDFDNDGFLDIFFTNGARIPSLSKDNSSFYNRLYRNKGDGTFIDVTEKAGVRGAGYSIGSTTGDFDNDAFVDLYVAGVNSNTLYRNKGDGTFADVTDAAGITGRLPSGKKAWSIGGAWLDYDNDSDLDLFVVNYVDWSMANNHLCGDPGKRLSCSPVAYNGLPNFLYRNDGNGKFTDVSEPAGIASHIGKGMGMALADFDNDGFIDIFVGNDSERNFLFHNIGGKSFAEVGVESGIAFGEDGIPISSMGVDFRDVNNDGLPDVSITALANETFPLFLNSKSGYFTDSTYRSGIGTSSFTMSGWGMGIADFDNDGFKDIFTAGCHVSENIEKYRHEKYKLPNSVWQNLDGVSFKSSGVEAGFSPETAAAHRGVAFGDLDNDGRVDAVVSVIGGKAEVLLNQSSRDYNWITLITEGSASNRDGIGTKIKLTTASGVQYNHTTTCVGYASASDKRVHFGLGPDKTIREIELQWPSGKHQVLKDVAANQILRVKEQ